MLPTSVLVQYLPLLGEVLGVVGDGEGSKKDANPSPLFVVASF